MSSQIPEESQHYRYRGTNIKVACGNCSYGVTIRGTLWCKKDIPPRRTQKRWWCAGHHAIQAGDAVVVKFLGEIFFGPMEPPNLNLLQKIAFRARRVWLPETKLAARRWWWTATDWTNRLWTPIGWAISVLTALAVGIASQWVWIAWFGVP